MKRQRVLGGFLTFCLTMMCMFGLIAQRVEICQAGERLIDIEGKFIGRDDGEEERVVNLNVGARIEPEYFEIKALILDTNTYDVDEVILDPDDYTVSPKYMQSERQQVTVRYRFNGTTKTLTFTIKAPEGLIISKELLSISAKYEGQPLSVGMAIDRRDVVVTARYKTSYKTGKTSTIDEELTESDSWTMSNNIVEDGLNNIVISYSFTDTYAERKKTYRKTTTISVNSATVDGEWIQEGNAWRYHYDDDTYKVGAWQKTRGKWYYLDEYGYMVSNQFMELDDVMYLFGGNGAMATDWAKYKGDWYYFDSDGALQKDGWFYIRGKWYYLKENGVMDTGWKFDKGKWYYLDKENGDMKIGWVFDNVTWYYMDKNGALMESCWIKSADGKWYYLDVGGAMRVNTWIGNYYVDRTGAWTDTKKE